MFTAECVMKGQLERVLINHFAERLSSLNDLGKTMLKIAQDVSRFLTIVIHTSWVLRHNCQVFLNVPCGSYSLELTLEKSPTGDLCIAIVSFSSVGLKKNFLR